MLNDLKMFENDKYVQRICKGMYLADSFHVDMALSNATGKLGNYDYEKSYFSVGELNSYGVVDSPEQFIQKFENVLNLFDKEISVFFTHIAKNAENAGKGGGWRWHKWGQYYGEKQITAEYLDDEDEFDDGVYVFHMYITDDINKKCLGYFDVQFENDEENFSFRYYFDSEDRANERKSNMISNSFVEKLNFGDLVFFER